MSGKPLGRVSSELEHVLDDAGLTSHVEFIGSDPSGEIPDFKEKWSSPAKLNCDNQPKGINDLPNFIGLGKSANAFRAWSCGRSS